MADSETPRRRLAKAIPRRPRVSWTLGILFALGFAALTMPAITADRWLGATVVEGTPAPVTVRVPSLAGWESSTKKFGTGGIVIARGQIATATDAENAKVVADTTPKGALPYGALFLLPFVLAAIFTHHLRRSTRGRLVRVQLTSLAAIAVTVFAVKAALLFTSMSALVVPVALFSLVATIALDRIVGLATGVLAALVIGLLGPFDVGIAIMLLVQAAVAGLVVAEQPKDRVRAVLVAGGITTLCTAGTFVLLSFLTTGALPTLADPLHSPWFAALLGPVIASVLAVPLVPVYQLLVGEITRAKLVELEDLSHPLLRQIAEKSPGTWQHSLMMANMAEIAANAIGASGRLVRVGALFHDLGKSLTPKYFIENLDPGETSPHDKLPPEVSTDAIFAHVTEGIVTARRAGLHERIVDFMHMHHGNGVLEYFWGKAQEQGNPNGFTVDDFRYPGHPPQSRETAILTICDAVEAASRTLKKPDAKSIDALVQRIVYGKLHLGQLDESGLSMADLRILSNSLKETIRHANHGRIEYPWQKAQQDASATETAPTGTHPRLDSLDRSPATGKRVKPQLEIVESKEITNPALAATADLRSKNADESDALLETAPHGVPGASDAPSDERASVDRGRPSSAPPPIPRTRTSSEQPSVRASTRSGEQAIVSTGEHSTSELIPPRTKSADFAPVPSGLARPGRAAPRGPTTLERQAAASAGDASEWNDAVAAKGEKKPVQAAADASWTEVGAQGAPWPELAGEQSEPVADDPGMVTLRGHGQKERPPEIEPRKRAATLPPVMPLRRAPTVQPLDARRSGPPSPLDLDNATTNPPPVRFNTTLAPTGSARPPAPRGALIAEDVPPTAYTDATATGIPRVDIDDADLEERVTLPPMNENLRTTIPPDDAGTTTPSLPQMDDAGDPTIGDDTSPAIPMRDEPRTNPAMPRFADVRPRPNKPPPSSLASRIDAAMSDEWANETPVKAPTSAELRSLLGSPDPTRQQSIEEIERLHQQAKETDTPEPDILQPRRLHGSTHEVDPDDIEAAIEIVPPARRPASLGVAKPKKPSE